MKLIKNYRKNPGIFTFFSVIFIVFVYSIIYGISKTRKIMKIMFCVFGAIILSATSLADEILTYHC